MTMIWVWHYQRRLPSPGFQVEVVILDHDAPIPKKKTAESAVTQSAAIGTEPPTTSTSNEVITQDTTSSSPGADVPVDSKDGEEDIFTGIAPIAKCKLYCSGF